jgi:hypothetical protein
MSCQGILARKLPMALLTRERLRTSVCFVYRVSSAFMCCTILRLRVLSCLWRRLQSAGILAMRKMPWRTIRSPALVCVFLQNRQLSLRVAGSVSGCVSMSGFDKGGSQWEGRQTPSIHGILHISREALVRGREGPKCPSKHRSGLNEGVLGRDLRLPRLEESKLVVFDISHESCCPFQRPVALM